MNVYDYNWEPCHGLFIMKLWSMDFLEVVYKDAVAIEFSGLRGLTFEREKRFDINYKGINFTP